MEVRWEAKLLLTSMLMTTIILLYDGTKERVMVVEAVIKNVRKGDRVEVIDEMIFNFVENWQGNLITRGWNYVETWIVR